MNASIPSVTGSQQAIGGGAWYWSLWCTVAGRSASAHTLWDTLRAITPVSVACGANLIQFPPSPSSCSIPEGPPALCSCRSQTSRNLNQENNCPLVSGNTVFSGFLFNLCCVLTPCCISSVFFSNLSPCSSEHWSQHSLQRPFLTVLLQKLGGPGTCRAGVQGPQ